MVHPRDPSSVEFSHRFRNAAIRAGVGRDSSLMQETFSTSATMRATRSTDMCTYGRCAARA
eukprot:360225-Pleurochrysis_carterae.AAC.2